MSRNKDSILLDYNVEKNFLYSKEATQLIVDNYDGLSIQKDIVGYLIENLTEYYNQNDIAYVDSFLFPEQQTKLHKEIIAKILQQKESVLFDYYFTKTFINVEKIDFISTVIYVSGINNDIKPNDIRKYYLSKLNDFLENKSTDEIEVFFNVARSSFEELTNTYFTIDLYNNFIIPALHRKLSEFKINNLEDLKVTYILINKYPELRYSRLSRIFISAYEFINSKDDYVVSDPDITYDVQEYVEKIMISDKLLCFNFIYFCSYFDSKIDMRKGLNLIINVLEETNTISLSKTKYDKTKERTVFESLLYIEWVIENHHDVVLSDDFYKILKDFLSFNWHTFTNNNKTFLIMKSKLANYEYLDFAIDEIKNEQLPRYKAFYYKYKPLIISSTITVTLFIILCYFGINIVTDLLVPINEQLTLLMIILGESIVAAFLTVMMMLSVDNKKTS